MTAPIAHASHTHFVPAGRPWLRAGVWLSLGLLALWVLIGGHSDLYIAANVRWTLWLATTASLVLASIDGYIAWQRGDHLGDVPARLRRLAWRRWQTTSYGVLFAPLVIGILVPPLILGAGSILAHDGVVTLIPAPQGPVMQTALTQLSQAKVPTPIVEMSLLQLQDRVRAGAPLAGTPVTLLGFVYHQPGLPTGDVLLTRFITPHCVAEAQPLALVMRQPETASVGSKLLMPHDNNWVRVTGTLADGTAQGQAVAVLAISALTPMATPLDPYLIY